MADRDPTVSLYGFDGVARYYVSGSTMYEYGTGRVAGYISGLPEGSDLQTEAQRQIEPLSVHSYDGGRPLYWVDVNQLNPYSSGLEVLYFGNETEAEEPEDAATRTQIDGERVDADRQVDSSSAPARPPQRHGKTDLPRGRQRRRS